MSGAEAGVFARWDAAVNAAGLINRLDLDYPAFGFNIFGTTINSNSVYRTFGEIMDVPVHDFPGVIEPGWGNRVLTPQQIDVLKFRPGSSGSVDWIEIFASADASGAVENPFTLITDTSGSPEHGNTADPNAPVTADVQTVLLTTTAWLTGVGNVNTTSGVVAIENYFLTDGNRVANMNIGLRPGGGLGLTLPSDSSPTLLAGELDLASAGLPQLEPADPLVLDLDGDGVRLTDYGSAPVLFDIDHDGTGSKEQTGWASHFDGIVVYDLNGNGAIDGIHETLSEYFNGVVGIASGAGEKRYANGFAALNSLDSHTDNVFNSLDVAWANVRVWVDGNHDGKTDAGELRTLESLGITQIDLKYTFESGLVRDGNEVLASGKFVMNDLEREALAASFVANPNGHTVTTTASGTVVSTEAGTGAAATSAYVSAITTGESIDVSLLGVRNAYGGSGDDTLTGDANNNWLAGGLGSDTFNAGDGDDVLLIDAADLQANIHAGAGTDIVQVLGAAGVTLNLAAAEVEVVMGGRGNDVVIGGGRSSVFIRGGDGDDIIIGGAANDALSGEDGDDLIDGGQSNDVIRGHRGSDVLMGGAGDDLIDGGQDDDRLAGGAGNDVLKGGQGDDTIDGGDGIDVAEYSGSYADYRITHTAGGFFISDRVAGRDGSDFVKNVEKLNFRDTSLLDPTLANPLPVKDVLAVDKSGAALVRAADAYRFTQAQLLGNDIDLQGNALSITQFSDMQGGSVAIEAGSGDVVFTPTASRRHGLQIHHRRLGGSQRRHGHRPRHLPDSGLEGRCCFKDL
jgi:Ca2+-binding RTX toxin-like protein